MLFLIIMWLAVGCHRERLPEDVMSPEQMISYLIDLHIAEASVQNLRLRRDSAEVVFAAREKYLLKEHQITDSLFIRSYNYYLRHPDKLEEIYAAVVDSLSLRQSLLK